VDTWLAGVRDALAQATGVEPGELELDARAVGMLLDVARVAAHESGNRINAPLVCYLIGRAQGACDLETLADIVHATEPA
jgi:hypothetical protein